MPDSHTHLTDLLVSDRVSDVLYQQRLSALVRLLDVTRELAAEVDLNTILQTIAQAACQALVCERATLFQYDPARNELFTRVATELEVSDIRRSLDHGISGYVARHRQMVNVPDPAKDPRWSPEIDRRTGYHTRNILAAPLTSPRDGALLGVGLGGGAGAGGGSELAGPEDEPPPPQAVSAHSARDKIRVRRTVATFLLCIFAPMLSRFATKSLGGDRFALHGGGQAR